jgi:hypothetical protein
MNRKRNDELDDTVEKETVPKEGAPDEWRPSVWLSKRRPALPAF